MKVIITKIGLDGHDIGAKLVASALRDAGTEVVYLGMFQTAGGIVKAAIEEDADVIGVSCLEGQHLTAIPRLIRALKEQQRTDIPVVVGGVMPREDVATLKQAGVKEVFRTGTPFPEIITYIKTLGKQDKGSRKAG